MQRNGHVSTFTKSKLQVLHVALDCCLVYTCMQSHTTEIVSVAIYDSSLNFIFANCGNFSLIPYTLI